MNKDCMFFVYTIFVLIMIILFGTYYHFKAITCMEEHRHPAYSAIVSVDAKRREVLIHFPENVVLTVLDEVKK
jgi:hypothetical protein